MLHAYDVFVMEVMEIHEAVDRQSVPKKRKTESTDLFFNFS